MVEEPLSSVVSPTPVFLPGKFHVQRNLVGCSQWGCKESDPTERIVVLIFRGFLDGSEPEMQETWFDPWVGKIPWRREWLPTPVFLSGESHRQRSLAGYNPRGRKELDMTKQLGILWK